MMSIAKLLAGVIAATLFAACAQIRPIAPPWILQVPPARSGAERVDDGSKGSRATDPAASAGATGASIRNVLNCPPSPVVVAATPKPVPVPSYPAYPKYPPYPPYPGCAPVGPTDAQPAKCPDLSQVLASSQRACKALLDTQAAKIQAAKSESIQFKLWPAVEYSGPPGGSWLLLGIPATAVLLLLGLAWLANKPLLKIWEDSKTMKDVRAEVARATAVVLSLGSLIPFVVFVLVLVAAMAAAVFLRGSGARPDAVTPPSQVVYVDPSASVTGELRPGTDLALARAEAEQLRRQLAASQGELAGFRAAFMAGGREQEFWTPFVLGWIVGAIIAAACALALCRAWRVDRPGRKLRRGMATLDKEAASRDRTEPTASSGLLVKRAALWREEVKCAYASLDGLLERPPGGGEPAPPPAPAPAPAPEPTPTQWLANVRDQAVALRRALQEVIDYSSLEAT